jgi:predicted RNase H-like nuclease (RuvC/YqgF family)
MAKYNAATHTIESDDGSIILAILHPSVRADKGFEIADSWQGRPLHDYEMLEEDLSVAEQGRAESRSNAEWHEKECRNLEYDNDRLKIRIEELEAELAELKEKGAAAA